MGWTFFWLMVVLKVPIAALFYIVWWAVHQTDDAAAGEGDGGVGTRNPTEPRPGHGRPRRRGPHGDPAHGAGGARTRPPAPARAATAARHADAEHRRIG